MLSVRAINHIWEHDYRITLKNKVDCLLVLHVILFFGSFVIYLLMVAKNAKIISSFQLFKPCNWY